MVGGDASEREDHPAARDHVRSLIGAALVALTGSVTSIVLAGLKSSEAIVIAGAAAILVGAAFGAVIARAVSDGDVTRHKQPVAAEEHSAGPPFDFMAERQHTVKAVKDAGSDPQLVGPERDTDAA